VKAHRSSMVAGTALAFILVFGASVAAAAAGRVGFVNGIPGTKVDVCVNNHVVKSGLRYGRAVLRDLRNGDKHLKFRKDKAGCSGQLISKRFFVVDPGDDLTIVATKHQPDRVLLFDNASLAHIPGNGNIMNRHAADIGVAGFKYSLPDDGTPWIDVVDDPWEKGSWGWGFRNAGFLMNWWAHQPPLQRAIAGPFQLVVKADRRHEQILVGTTLGNARFVRFDVPDPS
jgi:hypothetical protein